MGGNVSFNIPIKNGLKQSNASSPLLYNFAIEYIIMKVQEHQVALKLIGTHQLLAYADDVNIQKLEACDTFHKSVSEF
jgi:hypothetical protein